MTRWPPETRAARPWSPARARRPPPRRQWCEAVVEFTERRRFVPLQSWCRAIYGAVLDRAGELEGRAAPTEALRRQDGHGKATAPRSRWRCSPSSDCAREDGGGRASARGPRRPPAARPVSLAPAARAGCAPCSSAAGQRPTPAPLRGALARAATDLAAATRAAEAARAGEAARPQRLRAEAALSQASLARTATRPRPPQSGRQCRRALLRARVPARGGRPRLPLARVHDQEGSPQAIASAPPGARQFEGLGAHPDVDLAAALLRSRRHRPNPTRGDRTS